MIDPLSARNLAKFGMRRGAYDGANRRRFVLFTSGVSTSDESVEWRREFDTKNERDQFALRYLNALIAERAKVMEKAA